MWLCHGIFRNPRIGNERIGNKFRLSTVVQYWSIATTFGFVPFLLLLDPKIAHSVWVRVSSIPPFLPYLSFCCKSNVCVFSCGKGLGMHSKLDLLGIMRRDLFISTCALVSFNLYTVAIHTFFFFLFVKIGFPYVRRNKSKNIISFCFMFMIQLEKSLFAKNYFFNIRHPDKNFWRRNLIEIGIVYYTTV